AARTTAAPGACTRSHPPQSRALPPTGEVRRSPAHGGSWLALRHTQERTARSGIARELVGRGAQLPADELEKGAGLGRDHRQLAESGIHLRLALHEALHHPIFERMEADDGESSARCEHLERGLQA